MFHLSKKNVPELRFPEFEGEWKNISINDKFEFYSTNSLSRSNLDNNSGDIKNIHYGDIHTKFPTIVDIQKEDVPYVADFVPNTKINKYELCKDGDLLIADASENYEDIGKTIELNNIQSNKVIGGLHTLLLRDKTNNNALKFNGYYFQSEKIKHDFKIIANGASVLGINKKDLKKLYLKIPSKEEQNKLAGFLSVVDKKIKLMEKKYALYCSIRKYFIENLFSNHAKSPNLRFNEFEDKWIKYPLKQLLKEIKIKSKFNNEYPLLSSTVNGIYLQKDYFNRNVGSKSNEGYKILSLNQIVLSPQNLWMGNINVNEKYDKGIVSPSYKIYDVTKLIRSDFIKYILKTPRLLYEYKISSEQGASIVRRNLNQQLFKEIEITIPSINEQEKIANFMLTWDMKIIGIKNQMQNIRKFKKGLLQKMFC